MFVYDGVIRLDQETDLETLRQAAVLLERENKRLVQMVLELRTRLLKLQGADAQQLQMQIDELERQLAARNRALFGDKSEKRPSGEKKDAPPKPPQKGHGPRPQPQLAMLAVLHEMDAADRVCKSCGGQLDPWEGQFEESEEIDVIERQFVIKKHRRQKYRCTCGACIETAPAPLKLFEGARYSIDFAVDVAVQKYLDHLPLERQVRIMRREGLEVDSQTLWDQIERLARSLRGVPERIRQYILSHDVVFADETPWRLMRPKRGPPIENKKWWVWSVAVPDAVYYRMLDTRSAAGAAALLDGYAGRVMCDGLSSYSALAKERPDLVLAHCWAHVRRRILEIQDSFPEQAKQGLDLIGELYAVEALCPAGRDGDEMRRKLRAERSRPVIARLRHWATTTEATPESGLAKAIDYMAGIWTGLTRFLDEPRLALDNNLVERALRDPVIGRKNFYGSKSKRGLAVAGLFYTVLHSAKFAGIEPKEYLRQAVRSALQDQPVPLPHEVIR